jgi:hypothetical protein
MKHSHYAVMGGFAIIPGELNARGYHDMFLPRYFERLTITPDGLEFLANLDIELVLNTSESEIRDKSNANGLGKALVCIQAFWFCIQCVTRLCQGLEISLLESPCTQFKRMSQTRKILPMHRKPPSVILPLMSPRTFRFSYSESRVHENGHVRLQYGLPKDELRKERYPPST